MPAETITRSGKKFKEGEIDWVACTIIFAPHLMWLLAFYQGVEFNWNTFWVIAAFYHVSMLGITMGYHRLFSHRAFTASTSLQWFLAIAGAGAFQGSVKWWGRNHRIHHRYVDTDKDPYNAKLGFWHTHLGWMVWKPDTSKYGHMEVPDFKTNKVIMFQHIYYFPIAMTAGIIAPVLVMGLLWGDWAGGFFYGAMLKTSLLHHSTFFINSLAHTDLTFAFQNFSSKHTSHDSVLCALLTLGEGYHNFHHEFAQDYRNGTKWYHWDPTKWAIRICEMCGSATNLVRFPNDVIKRNIYDMRDEKHKNDLLRNNAKLASLEKSVATVAVMEWPEFESRCAKGEKLTVVAGFVLDLNKPVPIGSGYTHESTDVSWFNTHPGGTKMMQNYVGKDATAAMSGEVYGHSQGAFNVVKHLRIASLSKNSEGAQSAH